MAARREFKRVVVGLHQSLVDRSAMKLAAEFAELLRLDMFGLFIEDPGIAGLAELPFVREYRTLGRGWQPIEVERLAREFELAALAARRLFTETAATHRVTCSFEVMRATTEHAITSMSRSTDIVLIAEPKSAVDRVAGPFPGLTSAAFRSEAAVLLVPRQVARTRGPVVALATASDDPSIDAAIAIAAAAKESVIVVTTHAEQEVANRARADAPPDMLVEIVQIPSGALSNERIVSSVLDRFRERLIVVSRGAFGPGKEAVPSSLASLRGVPVLMVEPAAGQG